MPVSVNALVLAGRAASDALRDYAAARCKALVDINGKPMIQYVIDGLSASARVERVLVVGPRADLAAAISGSKVQLADDGDGIVENIRIGARLLPSDQPILIAGSDIPLLTAEVVDAFLDMCQQRQADLYYPIVERSVSERKYPLVRRTYVTLREGVFTGGNIFLIAPWIVEPVAPKAAAFIARRKSPLQLSRMLGFGFVLRLLLKQLTIAELEARIGALWGVRGAAVIFPLPEVGIDVDKPDDLQLVRAVLR